VEIYDRADGSLRMHVEEGLLSAQSTPLVTRSGKPIGMVSTHWRNHHRPTERELRFLDLLARQAADLIELRQAQERIRKSEAHLAAELEERVRERTRELAEANVSLRSEVTERRLGEQRIKKLLRQVVNAQEEHDRGVSQSRRRPAKQAAIKSVFGRR
jgi:GAF domain-containing protein